MDITIHSSFLPHDDPEASLAFYRDTLGFEVRLDVGQGTMRWITVGPADQPRTIVEMMAKGTFATLLLATHDLDGTFDKVQSGYVDVVQEPTEQPYGVRDCALRD